MLTLRILVFSGGPECPLSLPSLFLSSLFGSSSFYSKKNVFLQQARVTYNDGTLIKELCLSVWHLGMSESHFIAYWLAEEGPAQCGSFLSVFPGYSENSELPPWTKLFSLFSALTAVGISIQRFLMEVKWHIPEASLSPQTLSPVLPKPEFLKNALYTKWTVSPKSPIYQPWSPETGRKRLEQLGIFWNFRFSSLDSGIDLHCVFSIPGVFPIIVTLYCGSHLENLYTGTHCLSVLMDPVKYFLCKRESINVFQILQTRFCFVPSVWRFLYHL